MPFPRLALIAFGTALAGCDAATPEPPAEAGIDGLGAPDGFDYATTRAVEVRLRALDTQGAPLAAVPVAVFDPAGQRLATGLTPADGTLVLSLAVPTDTDTLVERPSGFFVNTQPEAPAVAPGRLAVEVEFSYPIPLSTLRLDELDLFLVADGERGREIYLPGRQPTDNADAARFGTSADATVPGTDRTYVTAQGLPWALHLPQAFVYPTDRSPLDDGHLRFVTWARSGGTASPDGCDLPGHRASAHLYAC